jgi:hypothetical protein
MLLLFACACDFSAASGVVLDDTAADSASAEDTGPGDTDGEDTDTKDTDVEDTDTAPPDPLAVDNDGDGWAEWDGDCDDGDITVFPGAEDVCNGLDDDCDDAVDEDAAPDGYEPNDADAYLLGSLDDDPELTAVAALAGEGDVDRYAFSFDDSSFSLFTVTASLTGIPDDATWRFTLTRLSSDGGLAAEEIAQTFGSGSLSLSLSDVVLQEDGGTYELVVESISGADCGRTYLLAVAW